jgi:hypothetical protein
MDAAKPRWLYCYLAMTGTLVLAKSDRTKQSKAFRCGRDTAASPAPYFFSAISAGSSFFLSLPAMKGLHGCALTGPGVFHTTLN